MHKSQFYAKYPARTGCHRCVLLYTKEYMETTHFRPEWDDYFMAVARLISTRATCDRLHTGAVLVKENRIVSTGYNGSPPGLEHCDDVGHLLEDGHCVRTIHGEHNVLLQAALTGAASTNGTTLYTLYSPCIHCAKYIIAAGVKRIVIAKMYRNNVVIEYLTKAGLQVDMYQPIPEWNAYVSNLFAEDVEERDEQQVTFEGKH